MRFLLHRSSSQGVCKSGARAESMNIKFDPVRMSIKTYRWAITLEGQDRVELKDYQGEARTTRQPDGNLRIEILGRPHRGERGEPAVLIVLRQAIEADSGSRPTITKGRNDWGEDATLKMLGAGEYIVQIVSVPADPQFGKEIASGKVDRTFTVREAARMIREAINHKSTVPPSSRGSVILALDARHLGLLSGHDVLAALADTGSPIATYGFAQVWLVGSTITQSARLA